MKQITLDIGLATGPTLKSFFAGPNQAALEHLQLWLGSKANASTRSPVPTYLWGTEGSGRTHLLKAVQESLREQRLAAWREMSSIVRQCDGETRMLSPAEKARFDALDDELISLDSRIAAAIAAVH